MLKEISLGAMRTTGPELSNNRFSIVGLFSWGKKVGRDLTVFLMKFQGLVWLSAAQEAPAVGKLHTRIRPLLPSNPIQDGAHDLHC